MSKQIRKCPYSYSGGWAMDCRTDCMSWRKIDRIVVKWTEPEIGKLQIPCKWDDVYGCIRLEGDEI